MKCVIKQKPITEEHGSNYHFDSYVVEMRYDGTLISDGDINKAQVFQNGYELYKTLTKILTYHPELKTRLQIQLLK